MVRQRRPVQSLQEAVQAQPVANPVAPHTTVAPLSLPVFDFAAISSTLTDYLADREKKEAARKSQEAQRFVAEHGEVVSHIEGEAAKLKTPEEQDAYLREQFAFLKRQGIIPPMADPYSQIGYAKASGRLMASLYRDRLRARLSEMSAARDQNGEPSAAPDVEGVIADEWGKIADSPSVRNFYGGQEALGLKAQVDEEFRTTVSNRRAEVQQRDYEDMLKREIGGQFDYILQANPVVTSETLQGITQMITQEVQQHNVPRPRELAMEAIELSVQRQAAIDPDEAVRMVHAAQDLVVGDVRLGDDRSGVGLRLQELTRRVREQANEHALTEIQRESAERKLAVQEAEKEYVPLLVQAKREGQSVQAMAQRLGAKFLQEDAETGRFRGRGAFVVDALNDYANSQDAARQSDQQVLSDFHRLLATGQLDAADTLLRASVDHLTGEDYASSLKELSQRGEASQLVEQNSVFNEVAGRYGELKPTGFHPDVQQKIDGQVQDLRLRMERDYVALVQKTGKTDRKWLDDRWAADQEAIRKIEQENRGDRDTAEVEVRKRMSRYQDATEVIDQGERSGAFTVTEAQTLREQNIAAAAGRESLVNSPAFQDAQAQLAQRLKDEPELLQAGIRELHDRYAGAVDDMLGNEKIDPRSFQVRAESELRRVQRELEEQLFPSVKTEGGVPSATLGAGKAERALKAGKSAEAIQAAQDVLKADLKSADSLATVVSDPRSRERLSDQHPYFKEVQDPSVPQDFYRYAASWMSGLDPIFGSPVRREDVELRAKDILSRLPEDKREGAVQSIVSVLGVDATDVMRGQFEINLVPANEADLRRDLQFLSQPLLSIPPEDSDELRARINARLEPVKLDLSKVEWRPFTTPFFRSPQAMEAFSNDPAWPEFLQRVGIDPEDPSELRAFEDAQIAAIHRTNP